MLQAVLLDVYGTLIDSPEYVSPYAAIFLELELEPAEIDTARRLLMTTALPTIEAAADVVARRLRRSPVGADTLARAVTEIHRHVRSFSVMDGVHDTLAALRQEGYGLALVTNLSTPYKECVQRLGLEEYVDRAIYSCDVGCLKPEPEIFRLALESLGVSAPQAVMVGDNEIDDIAGAEAAGLRAVHIDAAVVATGAGGEAVGGRLAAGVAATGGMADGTPAAGARHQLTSIRQLPAALARLGDAW